MAGGGVRNSWYATACVCTKAFAPGVVPSPRSTADDRASELDEPRVRERGARDAKVERKRPIPLARVHPRQRDLQILVGFHLIHRVAERARHRRNRVVVVEIDDAPEEGGELLLQGQASARIGVGRVGIGALAGGDRKLVDGRRGERCVEGGDERVAVGRQRVHPCDVVGALRLLLDERDRLPFRGRRRGERGELRDVDRIRERAAHVGVADVVKRRAGDVFAERLRADPVAEHRVELATEGAARRSIARRGEIGTAHGRHGHAGDDGACAFRSSTFHRGPTGAGRERRSGTLRRRRRGRRRASAVAA